MPELNTPEAIEERLAEIEKIYRSPLEEIGWIPGESKHEFIDDEYIATREVKRFSNPTLHIGLCEFETAQLLQNQETINNSLELCHTLLSMLKERDEKYYSW